MYGLDENTYEAIVNEVKNDIKNAVKAYERALSMLKYEIRSNAEHGHPLEKNFPYAEYARSVKNRILVLEKHLEKLNRIRMENTGVGL